MAFDIQPEGVKEPNLAVAGIGSTFSVGVNLVPGQQFKALGVTFALAKDPGPPAMNFDAIVQTAYKDALSTDAASWLDLNSRENAIGVDGVVSIIITDAGVLDKVRLKFAPNAVQSAVASNIYWTGDSAAIQLN